MHGKISIKRISGLLPMLILLLILVNLAAISFIGVIYYRIDMFENATGNYFRMINEYAISVLNSDGNISALLEEKYTNLENEFNRMNKLLRNGTVLKPPEFTSVAEVEVYRAHIRENASIVRTNLSNVIQRSYIHIGFMLAISAGASIFLLLSILAGRYAIRKYGKEITAGLEYMEKILKFEMHPDFVKTDTNIVEIEQLQNSLLNLSSDVLFNRKLIEKGVHGNLDILLSEIMDSFRKRMPCERIALSFLSPTGNLVAETAVTTYKTIFLNPGFTEPIASTSLADVIKSGEPRIINDLDSYSLNKRISRSTYFVLKEGIKSSITIPMLFNGKCLGFFFVSSRQKNAFTMEMMHYSHRILNLLKQKFYIEYLLQQVVSETSNAFILLMEEKDNETSAHIARMSRYSYTTAMFYHDNVKPLEPRFMREILWYSPLHDIGKVGIPDSILLKEGPLSPDEMQVMKNHVNIGSRVMEKMNASLLERVSFPLMQTAVEIIKGHHEKYDGSGYPEGLSGEGIPLAGRIVAVADVFDALTSRRPYKRALPVEEALNIMENDMVDSFDPEVMMAFKSGFPEILKTFEELKEI